MNYVTCHVIIFYNLLYKTHSGFSLFVDGLVASGSKRQKSIHFKLPDLPKKKVSHFEESFEEQEGKEDRPFSVGGRTWVCEIMLITITCNTHIRCFMTEKVVELQYKFQLQLIFARQTFLSHF